MPLTGKFFNFFVYSNLFIAACAVIMARHTSLLLVHTPPPPYFLAFIFSATICSYSFHWYLSSETSVIPSPRVKWMQRNRIIHLLLFIAGLTGSVFFFFDLANYWHWLLLSAIITFLYSAPKIPHKYFRVLRKIALGKTIFLALVWTHVTTILPVIVSDHPWQTDFTIFICSRFFLIYAICILFDYRDREDDKTKGIRSLITYLNEQGIRNLFVFSLLVFFILTLSLYFYDNYSGLTLIILLAPGIITATLFNYARKKFSDLLYYFILDGLMALSAILALLTEI